MLFLNTNKRNCTQNSFMNWKCKRHKLTFKSLKYIFEILHNMYVLLGFVDDRSMLYFLFSRLLTCRGPAIVLLAGYMHNTSRMHCWYTFLKLLCWIPNRHNWYFCRIVLVLSPPGSDTGLMLHIMNYLTKFLE